VLDIRERGVRNVVHTSNCHGQNCPRRATFRLGIDTLIAHILVVTVITKIAQKATKRDQISTKTVGDTNVHRGAVAALVVRRVRRRERPQRRRE